MFRFNVAILITLLLLSACAQKQTQCNLDRRNLSEYFVSSGTVRYFLPDIPLWANFSQTASCRRTGDIRFFDMQKLRNSFSMNYEQALQFQYMFNREMKLAQKRAKTGFLLFKDEEKLFYTVSDRIQAGIRSFIKPKYKRVHLIWIDPLLSSKDKLKRFKELMKSEVMTKGHPVLISFCLDYTQLREFRKKNKLEQQNIKLLPFEMFSVFDLNKELMTTFAIDLHQLFDSEQQLHLFLPGISEIPQEFVGEFKINKY